MSAETAGRSLEVAVLPGNPHCPSVGELRKVELAPEGSLLCCLGVSGRLELLEPADGEAPPAVVEGSYGDFCWEEKAVRKLRGGMSDSRLLTQGSEWDLKLLQVEAEPRTHVSVLHVSECPRERLLQTVRDKDPSVSQVQSLHLLQFSAGCCHLLLNDVWLLQLQWQEQEEDDVDEEEEAEDALMLSCCRVELSHSEPVVHFCVCRDTLFILAASGDVTVHNLTDGVQLARLHIPTYLCSGPEEDQVTFSLSSSSSLFCLFQVSGDLSTAVAVTQSNIAVAIDLNHYFKMHPDHLLCAAPQPNNPLGAPLPGDYDSISNSTRTLMALGGTFSPDRSLEARLASMYCRVQSAATSSSPNGAATSWWSSLPGHDFPLDLSLSHSRAPPGGAVATFSVPPSSTPSQLTVSQFTAILTFISPGNSHISVALWDIESLNVSYHHVEGEVAPVQRCGERQHRLMLKKTGLFQVLFGFSQQDLLSKLMLFCTASTVDAVCHLNNWGRCSVPIHTLKAGLKNRQLDTVDFYLKSKENLLDISDKPAGSSDSLVERVQELCPALDLLCSTVRDSHSEAQSRQFSEQLLNITTSFVNTQICTLLSHSNYEDSGVQSCVAILDRYVTELRSYMKKFPWSAGSHFSTTRSVVPSAKEEESDQWEQLPMEEVVCQSILTNQLPRAQALFWRQGRAESSLSALRMEGLRQVFFRLQGRDLQTAKTLLTNMGFNMKKELHNICRYTGNKCLRETMVEELSRQSYFPEEEMKSVVFIREMEKLRFLPPVHCSTRTNTRVLQMSNVEARSEEVLKEVVEESKTTKEEEGGGLWTNLRLDWVKNWDQSCQSAVLLSRLQHSELSSCESSVLWHYITALHDQLRVVNWIQNSEAPNLWPKLTPELVNNNTVCSTYMRENILDLLARRGVFIPEELADLEQLLWRLAQGGGVMASHPPTAHYRTSLGLDLHSVFISLCLRQNLQYLLYCYLEHYRLTPRNCPLLTNQSLSESQPWFEMLVRVQEITRDLSDPGLVFQASLTSAQVLLAGSQASLSSLLLEGHSLLALAATMFAPGGIDQVMAWGKRSRRSESMVDPQLLKMALAPYPKLKAALFPTGPRGASQPSDISVYHLLQSLPPLDPSRLFGWQVANTFNSSETSELPHFSSPHMVERFALVENLDFLYYLRHGRPSFAFATFLVQQLIGCSDAKELLQVAFQQVYSLALQCFHIPSVTSAAVCFCELLGVCSLKLRVDVRALNAILQHQNQQQMHLTPAVHLHTLITKGAKLTEADLEAAEDLIGDLEAAVADSLEQRGILRSSYEAAQEWTLPVQFCQLHGLALSSVYLSHCAQDKHFIHFLLFVQLHNFPAQQVRSLAAEFGPTLRAHLSMAFQDLQVYSQKRDHCSEKLSTSVRMESSGERPRELFQILLQSQEEPVPCKFLLQEALLQCCPTLAVLASCLQASELLPCLCVWMLTSVDDLTAAEATAHLPDAPEYHDWSLHDLSIIWKTLLGRGLVRPLLRGFELFQKDCPLVLVLRMFELCCDYRNFTEAKLKLLEFQRTLIALRNSVPSSEDVLPLQWVESQASVLLLAMLHHCSSQYDLHRLLQLLADVDKLLKSNGPDFRKLSQLSQLLQGSEVSLSPQLLQSNSASVQREEFQAAVDALQSRGMYSKARQVAQLGGLPVHRLLLSQLQQELNSQRSKHQWGKLEARLSFWMKCHDQLEADCTDPNSAANFFLSEADVGICQGQMELLDIQVRCLLLHLAGHWLAQISPAPRDQLEGLEKKLWQSRIRKQLLTVAIEKETVFKLPPPAITSDGNTYEALVKRFSFSKIPELNTEESLRLQGLPSPSEPQPDLDPEATLAPEERSVLAALVGQLLDEGSIHEASRVCRYFQLYHPDMQLVLRCRGLASGDLMPEPPEEDVPETPTWRNISNSHSFSSLSSFVMLPLPEDEVAVQLHKLVDQCRHGNSYCKQVLGLYQLSKELQCSFSQVCAEDPSSVLLRLLQWEQVERFRKAQAFIRAQGLSSDTVAQLVSSALVQGLLASTQELHPEEKLVFRPSEGRDSLVQLIKLCDDPNLVGVKLLENLSTVPLRDLNCIVELLIVAHDCFSLTCNMEGIVRVLQAARHLSHTYLAPGEQYSLLVRLLTGIGRYNEMTYIFDLLHQNHCFEMLLRKKVDTERGQSSSLKTALLDYIKRCLPADSEKHNMVALCFSMRREIGENHEMAARTQLKMIESQAWVVTPELNTSLVKVLNLLKDAAESFSKDSCVRQATRCVRTAKLVALQLHFLNQGSGLRIINLQPAELLNAALSLPRCYQVLVLSEAYSYTPDWAEILYQKVILNGDFAYFEELKHHRPINAVLFEDIFKKLDNAPSSVNANVKRLLTHCEDLYSRYRLAYQQNLYDVTKTLLQDAKTSNYLKDRLAS